MELRVCKVFKIFYELGKINNVMLLIGVINFCDVISKNG